MVLAFVLAAQVALAQEIPADFTVTLQRTACFGRCHVYTVTIDARGNVTYEGRTFVRVTGTVTDTVPLTRVRELLAAVERIGFFQLRDDYRTLPLARPSQQPSEPNCSRTRSRTTMWT